jgi:hypothetical protein
MFALAHDLNYVLSCVDFQRVVGIYDKETYYVRKLFTSEEIVLIKSLGFFC